LEYAGAMTVTHPGVDDDLRQKLKRQWNDDTIVELTGRSAFQNLSSKFNAALNVPSQGFCILQKGTSSRGSENHNPRRNDEAHLG
jgi:hypothetical protein